MVWRHDEPPVPRQPPCDPLPCGSLVQPPVQEQRQWSTLGTPGAHTTAQAAEHWVQLAAGEGVI